MQAVASVQLFATKRSVRKSKPILPFLFKAIEKLSIKLCSGMPMNFRKEKYFIDAFQTELGYFQNIQN